MPTSTSAGGACRDGRGLLATLAPLATQPLAAARGRAAGRRRCAHRRRRGDGQARPSISPARSSAARMSLADPDRIVDRYAGGQFPARSGARPAGARARRGDRQELPLRPARAGQVARRDRSRAAGLRRQGRDDADRQGRGGLRGWRSSSSAASASAFAAAAREGDGAAAAADDRRAPAPAAPGPTVIVLDPGHGGVDGGAYGVGGAVEKTLVYAFAAELQRQLEATGRYRVVLTRHGDEFVSLDDRVRHGARGARRAADLDPRRHAAGGRRRLRRDRLHLLRSRLRRRGGAHRRARERRRQGGRRRGEGRRRPASPTFCSTSSGAKRAPTPIIFSRGLVARAGGARRGSTTIPSARPASSC